MRRAKGKLSTFNWILVLLAGIFQITTFIFDQIVIQYEEDLRENNFKILSKSESRSAYLKMNNRVNDFLLAFENTVFLEKHSFLFKSCLLKVCCSETFCIFYFSIRLPFTVGQELGYGHLFLKRLQWRLGGLLGIL